MDVFYRILADIVVVVHAGFVAFVIFGQLIILIGWLLRWPWIKNMPFRLIHLTAIAVVVLQSWIGMTCPLTTWEKSLREAAGDVTYEGDFIANCVHQVLFYPFPPWVFTTCYTAFGALVLVTFIAAPPKPKIKRPNDEAQRRPPEAH